MRKYMIACLMAGVLTVFNSCSTNPVTGKKEVILMSEDQEIAMGAQADPEIVAHFGLYEDPALQRFIDEKGQKMAAISHRNNLKYSFRIVDSPVINAFAVPGGYVYFTRGIMAYFNNEAEFAGVLGHEIGHVAARHSAQQQSKAMLAQLGLIVGMVVSPEFAQFADIAQQGVGLLFLKFGRDAEREADRLGVEYSSKIGYDAEEMAEFFQTLQRTSEEAGAEPVPTFLSTHPSPADRQVVVSKLAKEWKQKLSLTNPEVARNSYLKMVDGMIFGEDPKQGFLENNVFYHPVLKFKFQTPTNWAFQNTPQQVSMADKEGKAMMTFTIAPGASLQEAAQQLMEKYKLQPIESNSVTVNGLPALAIVADQQPDQQQQQQQQAAIRTLTYLIQYGGNIYSMMGISTTTNFNNYAQLFLNSMKSFSTLTDPEKLNRQPERIQVRPVKQTNTLANALQAYNVKNDKLEEHAILNGMNLQDRVTQGTLIKIVERK
ncbi:M48 family metalloprotease [Pontibacter sp. MBLB2868]|uniref:M48 family metalloprotease n=1 Tax=Pontibacter sp. MBLB2868 TaxID=3451555 RepID=UPI003F74E8E0